MSALIWIQTDWYSDGIPEIILKALILMKIIEDEKKHAKLSR